jgi:hypothetical protein
MNIRYLWIASLSGAVLTTLVSNLPFIGGINCLLCAGFWGSAIFAVWLYRRLSANLSVRQAVIIGALTGLFSGILGFLLSFAGLAGAQGYLNSYSRLLSAQDLQGIQTLPAWAGMVFNLVGVLFNLLFGTLGGWIGGLIFKTPIAVQPMPEPN